MIEQGDLRLLDDPVAQRLPHSTELARLATAGPPPEVLRLRGHAEAFA